MRRLASLVVLTLAAVGVHAEPPAELARSADLAETSALAELGLIAPKSAPLRFQIDDSTALTVMGVMRGYYRNDQRIEWSGVEDSFGAEGILRTRFERERKPWVFAAEAELYLSLPNGRSILSDADRDLYRENFIVPPLQVFQLFAELRHGDWNVRLGRFRTPLGRNDSPILTNSFLDAPFLRTEVIGFTETGLLASWRPGVFSLQVGLTNGETELDTNSSKAVIGRLGAGQERWAVGMWVKAHDGISSEQQKRFNSFAGFDARLKFKRFSIYAEGVIDQHGLYRDLNAEGNPLALGPRSLYGRDIFVAPRRAIWGGGFDVGVLFRGDKFVVDVNYGLYFPEAIGNAAHDELIHRGVVKLLYAVGPRVQIFGAGLVENKRPHEVPFFDRAPPFAILGGLQIGF